MADKKVEEIVEVESTESEDETEDPVVAPKSTQTLGGAMIARPGPIFAKIPVPIGDAKLVFARSLQPLIFLECFSSSFAAPLS